MMEIDDFDTQPRSKRKNSQSLDIPQSSRDLLVDNKHVMTVLSVYQVLMRFWKTLRLSPFRVETFCAALISEENTALLSEIFTALIKAIVKDDEKSGASLAPSDAQHNSSIYFYLIDGLCLDGLDSAEFGSMELIQFLSSPAAPFLDIEFNLQLLQILIDQFISTNARNQLLSSPELDHEDYCRACGKIGELICCDRCTCVMHHECIPKGNAPDDQRVWICTICQQHSIRGVVDCMPQFEGPHGCSRLSCYGSDRDGRKYYLMARRIVSISSDGCHCWYYSTTSQFSRLMDWFDEAIPSENSLLKSISEFREEIERQMLITEALTDAGRGSLMSYFYWEDQQSRVKQEFNREESIDSLYVLGRDDDYKKYVNYFSADEHHSLSKRENEDEKNRKRTVMARFSQSPEFRWYGNIYGSYKQVLGTIRTSLIQFERGIPPAFMFSSWAFFKQNWVKAVNRCETHVQFSMAMSVFYSYINPIVFCSQWRESCGVLRLRRVTMADLEVQKNYEQNLLLIRDEEDEEPKTYPVAQFSKQFSHKIHKQKGEEYRQYCVGGWLWMGITASTRISPFYCLGLTAVSHKIFELLNESHDSEIKSSVVNEINRSQSHPNCAEALIDVSSGLLEHTVYSHWNVNVAKCDALLEKRLTLVDQRRNLIFNIIKAASVDNINGVRDLAERQTDDRIREDLLCFCHFLEDSNQIANTSTFITELYNAILLWFPSVTKASFDQAKRGSEAASGERLVSVHRFSTQSGKRSIFVLPQNQQIKVFRQGGLSPVIGFNYEQKVSLLFWPMPFVRPCFGVSWAYRTQTVQSISSFALQLKVLHVSLRWNQMNEQAPANGKCVSLVDGGTLTTEILERRPEGGASCPGERVEYLAHKSFMPSFGNDRDDYMRDYKHRQKMEEAYEVHEWVGEEMLQLWQIRLYYENVNAVGKTSPGNTSPSGKQKIVVVKTKEGISEVRGLKEGQQLVEGPDGSFKLVTQHRPDSYAPAYEPGMIGQRTSKICFKSPYRESRDDGRYVSTPRHVRNASKLLKNMEDFEMSPQTKSIQLVVKQYTRNPDDPEVKDRLFQYFRTNPDTVKFFMHQYELSMRFGDRGDNDLIYDTTMMHLENSMLSGSDDPESYRLRQTCVNVMKMMLEKVERHEKNSRRRITHTESSSVRQRKIINQRIMSQLHKQKESLKRSIIRKRTMTEQSIRREVKVEVQRYLESSASKGKMDKKEHRASERTSNNRRNTSPPKKNVQGDLYCVCRTPYDNTKFYIGCDKCKNWFHGACVNLTEDEAEKIESYICDECNGRTPRPPPTAPAKRSSRRQSAAPVEEPPKTMSRKRRTRENRLYCMCRKPFDYRDYISCETCEEWYHYECVGISKGEASMLKSYICVPCRSKRNDDAGVPHKNVFTVEHNLMIASFVGEIKLHKMSWPFVEAVSKTEFPDYYEIITDPIDLSLIEERATNDHYRWIDEFTAHLNLLFVNCRTYHQPNSVFYRCAENLESFVFNKLKGLVKKLFRI